MSWKDSWHVSSTGTPIPNLFNAMIALRHHPKLKQLVKYDEMQSTAVLVKQVPNKPDGPIPRQITDDDVLGVQEEMQLTGLRRIPNSTVHDALSLAASEAKFHPIREYLENLSEWDRKERLWKWLSIYAGIESSPYVDTIGRLFLIALVARIFEPGCQCDYMLILEGPQGAKKSTLCRLLAGGSEYFSDNLPDLSRADRHRVSGHLRGKWLIEIGEMSSFSAAESHVLKEFITQREERYRPPYGRKEVFQPRQCLFIGSTNEDVYLRDRTGGRRFWPVKVVHDIKLDRFAADRDQLLAEAVREYFLGAQWWPEPGFEMEEIVPQQKARQEQDPWEEVISSWLATGGVQGQPVKACTATEVLVGALRLTPSQMTQREIKRVRPIMEKLGWRQNGPQKSRREYVRRNDRA